MLITRHLLFVGFGMSDDHVHAIVDDVRHAVGERHGGKLGTAITLSDEPLLEHIWGRELTLVSMADGDNTATAANARRLEIFLDLLLGHAVHDQLPLLDPSYDSVLTPGERLFRDHLMAFLEGLPAEARGTMAHERLDSLVSDWKSSETRTVR